MTKRRRLDLFMLCAGACGLALSGCASSVSTRPAAASGKDIRYYLPKARMKIAYTAGYSASVSGAPANRNAAVVMDRLRLDVLTPTLTADTSQAYFLSMNPSTLSDDHFCIALSPEGMLTHVGVVASDRSGAILQRIAETVATFVGGVPFPPGFRLEGAEPVVVFDSEPFVVVEFDPDSADEIAITQLQIRAALMERAEQAQLAPVGLLAQATPKIEVKEAQVKIADKLRQPETALLSFQADEKGRSPLTGGADGVVYRSVSERSFVIGALGATTPVRVMMPDPATDTFVDFSRAPLVRKSTTMTLHKGMLASIEVDKPSEGLAVVSLPLNIAGAVIETPARFFTAIGSSFRAETGALVAEAELLKAEIELEKLRRGEAGAPAGGAAASGTSAATLSALPAQNEFIAATNCGAAK